MAKENKKQMDEKLSIEQIIKLLEVVAPLGVSFAIFLGQLMEKGLADDTTIDELLQKWNVNETESENLRRLGNEPV